MKRGLLITFSGLPGSGKSTLAKELARKKNAVYLRIDTIEQALRDLCDFNVQSEGYRITYRIAADNLKLGINVVADSCNPLDCTRQEWIHVALSNQAYFINIEVQCSNPTEHRTRVETRILEVLGLKLPTWEEVKNREFHPWKENRILIDTANK